MSAEAHAASELEGHTDEILALALSSDGKFLASGGRDRRIGVWGADKGAWLRSFGGHRDAISVCHATSPRWPWLKPVTFRPSFSEKAPKHSTRLRSIGH